MSHAINWFQISGPNGLALQKFYTQAFGWTLQNIPGDNGDLKMVPAGKDGIAGGIGTSHNKLPSVAVYISVGDIDAQFGKIQRAGGRMAMPKQELSGNMGHVAGFTDPAGNWIGLWMPPAEAPAPKASAKKAGGANTSKRPAAKKASTTAKRPAAKKAAAAPKKAAAAKKPAKAKAKAKKR